MGGLPEVFTEEEIAAHFDVSPATIARERRAGKIGFTKISGKVVYTPQHVADYLARNERGPCPSIKTGSSESANTGSTNAQTAPRGADAGTTEKPDKFDGGASRLLTFKPPSKS